MAVVRAADHRRRRGCRPDPPAGDRDFRAVRARRAGGLLRARHGGPTRDQALLFRAHPRFYRAPPGSLSPAGGDRPRLVAADRTILAAYFDFRPSKGAARLSAGRVRRLRAPHGVVRGPARARDPAADTRPPPELADRLNGVRVIVGR